MYARRRSPLRRIVYAGVGLDERKRLIHLRRI
jgi:hypothetical protein